MAKIVLVFAIMTVSSAQPEVAVEIQVRSLVGGSIRFAQNDNGALKFGAALDVNLYRSGSNLKTDNTLQAPSVVASSKRELWRCQLVLLRRFRVHIDDRLGRVAFGNEHHLGRDIQQRRRCFGHVRFGDIGSSFWSVTVAVCALSSGQNVFCVCQESAASHR